MESQRENDKMYANLDIPHSAAERESVRLKNLYPVHDNDVTYEHAMVDLKDKINALVWVHCPGTTTLAEAERLAGTIHVLFQAAWDAAKSK